MLWSELKKSRKTVKQNHILGTWDDSKNVFWGVGLSERMERGLCVK